MIIKDAIVKQGFAGGNYYNKCHICGRTFIGDKRAWNCFNCACQKADGDYIIIERATGMSIEEVLK